MRRNTTHKRRGKLKPRVPFMHGECFVCGEIVYYRLRRLSTGQTVCYKHWFGSDYYFRRFRTGSLAHETFAKLGITYKPKPVKRRTPKRPRDRQTIKRNPR